MITDKEKELITGEMLSDVLGFKINIITSPDYGHNESDIRYVGYRTGHISIYELKDKLEEWAVKRIDEMSEMDTFCDIPIFTIKMPLDDKYWWAGVEYYNGDVCEVDRKPLNYMGETKLEALLKLYHAIKATNAT